MIICTVADLHGEIVKIPNDIDVLLIAGDVLCHSTPNEYNMHKEIAYLNKIFAPWVEKLMKRCAVWITWGNHDTLFDRNINLAPSILQDISLINRSVIINGYKLYGTPYQPYFRGWSFNKYDTPDGLGKIYSSIPKDTDILLTHCPPYGILDKTEQGDRVGSMELMKRVNQINTKLHVFGHIHNSYGKQTNGETTFINAAQMNEKYIITNSPIIHKLHK